MLTSCPLPISTAIGCAWSHTLRMNSPSIRRRCAGSSNVTWRQDGKPVEQGIGAENPNANHFKALLLREQAGEEPKGAWAASVREFWKNNPEKAAALNLPRPEALAKLNAQL